VPAPEHPKQQHDCQTFYRIHDIAVFCGLVVWGQAIYIRRITVFPGNLHYFLVQHTNVVRIFYSVHHPVSHIVYYPLVPEREWVPNLQTPPDCQEHPTTFHAGCACNGVLFLLG